MTVRRVRSILPSICFALLLGGCAQQPQAEAQPQGQSVAVEVKNPEPDAAGSIEQPVVPKTGESNPAPIPFEYPADLGGRAVVKAVTPSAPPPVPTPRAGDLPKARALPTRLLNPETITKAAYTPPPVLPAKSVAVQLVPPVERVPVDIGNGAGALPAKPTLPVAVPITERSRDVSLPPPLPTFGRPLADRVSLDDPTAEFGNAAIASPLVKVPLTPAAFLRVGLPDPFEMAEQIKPKVPPSAEPGLTPVPINPRRVK